MDSGKERGGLSELIPWIGGNGGREACVTGDVACSPMGVGQSIGLIRYIPPCAERRERLMAEGGEQVRRLNGQMQAG